MKPWLDDGDVRVYLGDVRAVLAGLPDESVDCCITSPPYWGLRDYGAAGQLGLEATPDEYVANMVAVFREVRRVLAPHGTCWLNLGDSYVSVSGGQTQGVGGQMADRSVVKARAQVKDTNATRALPDSAQRRPPSVSGLKPKDLVGIPWSVAKALQAPYYVGAIPRERDRVWLAATIDAEGTICGFLHERKDDGRTRTGVHVSITNTNRALLDEAQRIWPTSREEHNVHGEGHRGSLPVWRWIAHGAESKANLMRELYPYLIVKREQAMLAYNLLAFQQDGKRLGRSAIGDEVRAKRELLTRLLSDANKQRPFDIPSWCIEPPSMLEPGWYLRAEIIWAKPNPMPESVTDRPTKSHEQVFLLAKAPRYWFDAEAVRETAQDRPQPSEADKVVSPNGETPWLNNRYARGASGYGHNPAGHNIRSVWDIATQPFPEAHFATYPQELVRRCLLAGCLAEVCSVCSRPRERIVETTGTYEDRKALGYDKAQNMVVGGHPGHHNGLHPPGMTHDLTPKSRVDRGWSDCGHNAYRPGVVLDPFLGSGTTALVARHHGRHAIGIELNEEYARISATRLQQLSLGVSA